MRRRDLLKAALAAPILPLLAHVGAASSRDSMHPISATDGTATLVRVRPGQPGWPSAADWDGLRQAVGGRLLQPVSPFTACPSTACTHGLAALHNPFAVGDDPALTQTSGWAQAWVSAPSAYAVAAQSAADVAAAVNFARSHRLRLVVKGGGHSYQGTSCAPDSLLVWPRHMNAVTVHASFTPAGAPVGTAGLPAVSVQAGALWMDAYHAVTTQAGRYVQGGGCTTVGVAGLVQSGGFGSFSKGFGSAAGNLLEAEVVTADGAIRVVNAFNEPELFWALKGGGGGSFGVVTRLTLRTFELPEFFGGVGLTVKADSDAAYRALIGQALGFYQRALCNPHWGEQMTFRDGNTLHVSMAFQGLRKQRAEQVWAPFLDWVQARHDCHISKPFQALAAPAQHLWDAELYRKHAPQFIRGDDRPGAPDWRMVWRGDSEQAGWFIDGYRSAWLPATLLQPDRQSQLVDAVFAAAQHHDFALHFNKGLAGAEAQAIARARDTATHPQMLDAFALAICAHGDDPAFPGMPGPGPDLAMARSHAAQIDAAMDALLTVAPNAGSYVAESDYFLRDWQQRYWGDNYPRLLAAKRRYDPDGLFCVHHGAGSEDWSADGFARAG